jgi:hypothetical protein
LAVSEKGGVPVTKSVNENNRSYLKGALAFSLFLFKSTRCEKMKKAMILGLLLLVVVLVIPAAGAGTGGMERAYPDAEGKENYLNDLSADIDLIYPTDPKKEERKAGLVARLNAIWEKYPVVSETRPGGSGYPAYGGSETTLRFAPSVTSTRLTDEENAAIRESAAIMKEAFERTHPTQPAPLPPVLVVVALIGVGLLIPHTRMVKK